MQDKASGWIISLGEDSYREDTFPALPDIKAPEAPSRPGCMAWVAEALQAERTAIIQEMTRRHEALLMELEAASSFAPEFQQCLGAARSAGNGTHLPMECHTDKQADVPDEVESQVPPNPDCTAHEHEDKMPFTSSEGEQGSQTEATKKQNSPQGKRLSADKQQVARRSSTFSTSPGSDRDLLQSAKGCTYLCLRMRLFIFGDFFELTLAFLIVLNAIVMAIEAQYISFDTAKELGWPGAQEAEKEWPGGSKALLVVEICFGVIFAVEVIAKAAVAPFRFVKSAWNWFDTLIVLFWVLSVFGMSIVLNPMLMRLARLARLTRLLRLVKTVQLFDVLHLLIGSLKASLSVLLWSLALLVAIMLVGALTFNFLLEPYILDKSNPYQKRVDVFVRFGSFSRAFVTMFETTLGNWVVPLRLLHENVSEWFGPVFLVWLCVVNFAVVQVIRAVFMHETFKVASSDDDLMIMQKARQMKKHSAAMQRFFLDADESGDGYLSLDEFLQITSDPRVKVWLGAMDLDISDAGLVFQLMGNKDGQLSAQELVQGVGKLKGAARSIDMIAVQTICRRIENYLLQINPAITRQKS